MARYWREWWATRQDKPSAELAQLGLAETQAALSDADPLVRLWAANAVLDANIAPVRLQAVWVVRDAMLDPTLGKAAAQAFDALSSRLPTLELLQPAPLAGNVAQVPNPPPPLVQDPTDPLEQASAAVALPPVPAELKEAVAQLVPLYRQFASKCWSDRTGEEGDSWGEECIAVMDKVRGVGPGTTQAAHWHAAARALFVPLGQGKLKLPKKLRDDGPVFATSMILGVEPEVASMVDQIVAHTASLALARPTWSEGETLLLTELTREYSKNALAAAALPLPWVTPRSDELRASLQRQVAAWNLRHALAKNNTAKPWARLSQQLARTGNLASRYRFACQSYWVDTKAERAESARLVRQVLLAPDVAANIRKEFNDGPCSELTRRELLVGTPWPAPAVAQSLVASAEAPEAAAPLSCQAALQGWYASEAVKACGAAVGDDGEPRAGGLWAQLDAGEDPTRIQALVEPWLPRLQGAALGSLREVWAAAATAAGQRQVVSERLVAWLNASPDGALADRLALLQGKPASPRWWLTAATGAQCVARRDHSVDAAWLARRGWIAGAPAFAKGLTGLPPSLRGQIEHRVAAACPGPGRGAD